MKDNTRIEIDDKVYVQYLKHGYFGVVKYIPNDVGDMWGILNEHSLEMINPNCSELVSISKSRKERLK